MTAAPLSAIAADDRWLRRFRTVLVVLLGIAVTGIAVLAFYTSFEAIRSYAIRSQGIAPEHGWAIPLLVDSFIVVATGADLWFVTTPKQRAWWELAWPKALLGSAASVSFILNIAHAEPTWAARGVAAIPPAALVLGVELLMMVLRRATSMRSDRLEQALAVEAERKHQLALERGEQHALPRVQAGPMSRAEQPEPPSLAATKEHELPAPRQQRPREPGPVLAASVRHPEGQRARDTFRPAGDAAERREARAAAERARYAASSGMGERLRADLRRDGNGTQQRRTPYTVAARLLDEREESEVVTPEALVEALAEEGVVTSLTTARSLLRELRPPLASRVPGSQPGHGERPRATGPKRDR